jgi:hypothetical protein
MTVAGLPPAASEYKHIQQVSEIDVQDLMTEVQRLIYHEVQQQALRPSCIV